MGIGSTAGDGMNASGGMRLLAAVLVQDTAGDTTADAPAFETSAAALRLMMTVPRTLSSASPDGEEDTLVTADGDLAVLASSGDNGFTELLAAAQSLLGLLSPSQASRWKVSG